MCTVTIVPKPNRQGAFRMACSRDESHGRSPALPPTSHTFRQTKALMPTDPESGGTWVGVNEHGLALTLLNCNLPKPPTGRDLSRGGVIPSLLHAESLAQLVGLASGIDRQRMMPFRLVACDGRTVLLWRSTEPIEQAECAAWDGVPVMFTSSGLGDHVVETPRRALFEGWFGDDPLAYVNEQASFHRHQWPGREHISVCMHREDARTVSYTTIDVAEDEIKMVYYADRPDGEADERVSSLEPKPAWR